MMISRTLALALFMLFAPTAIAAEKDDTALHEEMAEARRALAEAAQRVAELGAELGAEAGAFRILSEVPRHGLLGIGIADDRKGDTGGVEVLSVTPGGPADSAGIQAGDIVMALETADGDGTDLAKAERPSRALVKTLRELEPGEEVEVRYLRGDDERTVKVTLDDFHPRMFRFGVGERVLPRLPHLPPFLDLMHGWGDLELAPVSEELGEYFGTDEGLLVVRAPDDEARLRDGDIILAIGGRKPADPGQAMRILRSYRPGEKLVLDILRKRERMTLELEVPERRTGMLRDVETRRIFRPAAPE